MKTFALIAGLLLLVLTLQPAVAAPGLAAVTVAPAGDGGETWSLSIQVLAMMTALSLLPAALISMTSFTRIIIVLAILRQALGTAQTPPNQILVGLSLFLTLFVMSPVFGKIYNDGVKPYLDEQITPEQALQNGVAPLRSSCLPRRANPTWACSPISRNTTTRTVVTRDGTVFATGAGLRHQRAEDGIPDRIPDVHPVPGHRPGGRQRVDVDGHDDAVADADLTAVQDHAVRAGRWLGSAYRDAGIQFLCLQPGQPLCGCAAGAVEGIAMTPETVMTIGQRALEFTALISAPLLVIGAGRRPAHRHVPGRHPDHRK